MEVFTQRKWLSEGRKQFGNDIDKWRFKCPHCGRIQTIQDFKANSIRYGFAHVYFCCISRWLNPESCGFSCAEKPKRLVWWGAAETVKRHRVEVLSEKGLRVPVFQFAEAKQASDDFLFGSLRRSPLMDKPSEEVVQNHRGGWSIRDTGGVTYGNFATQADAQRAQKRNG